MNFHVSKGFTLIEITLSIAILSGIILGTLALYGAITSSRAKTNAATEVIDNASIALTLIEKKIRSASAINSGSSTFSIHPGVLSLATSASSTNPTTLRVVNGRLQITEGESSAIFLTDPQTEVSNFVVTSLSYPGTSGGTQIDLTLSYRNPQGDPNYAYARSYQTAVILRP